MRPEMFPLFHSSSSSSSSSSLLLLLLLALEPLAPASFSQPTLLSGEKCGNFSVPFPFHLSSSSASGATAAFRLSCSDSTLFLRLDRRNYRVIEFFSDGLLVDFPSTPRCRQFNELNSFGFSGNEFFGISPENVVGLYDCEDSSLCKAGCETNDLPGCDGGGDLGCCYPLSDQSAWRFGDDFSVFSKYGCRGFSSWLVPRGTNRGKRGVKLEWAIPRNSSKALCDRNARIVNASAVKGGVRCVCQDGFDGDGFVGGIGCLKLCYKDGKEAYGNKCYGKRHNGKQISVLAGVLAPIFVIGSLLAIFCLLKRPGFTGQFDSEKSYYNYHSTLSFRKGTRARFFTYRELEEATKGFQDSNKLAEGKNGTIYAGDLGDGSRVAVHKVHCENQREFLEISAQIDRLSMVSHRNLTRIVGYCLDYGYTPLVVYEYPGNYTLEDHLQLRESRKKACGLDWYKRINIAAEVGGLLASLQYEAYPPIFHNNIIPAYIFLDEDFHAKVSGFGFIARNDSKSCEILRSEKHDVYDFAVLLLEILTGSKQQEDTVVQVLQKIKNGKLEEILDPLLYFHEQPGIFREQMGVVADITTRCVLFGGDGKFDMVDAARELLQIVGGVGNKNGDGIEETFSNSSLLQMISMSPDSVHLPKN